MKKVAILTWHYFCNFGSALQAFALQSIIEKLGYDSKFLNYRDFKYGRSNSKKQKLQSLIHELFANKIALFSYPFQHFQQKKMKQTRIVSTVEEVTEISKSFDIVICGSDQIWAPNVLNLVYLLKYVPDEVRKISYAASIGLNGIPESLVQTYRDALQRFYAISIREEKGRGLLRERCGIEAKVVLDPTLLLEKKQWEQIERPVAKLKVKKYLFCYFLNENHNYRNCVEQFAKGNDMNIVGWSANKQDVAWMTILNRIGPCEFLWLIHNAFGIVTDSYHGTIFSILYHKKFITIERFNENDAICQNSRIDQLRYNFSLSDEIVPQCLPLKLSFVETDYSLIEKRLEELRKDSFDYLKKSLR